MALNVMLFSEDEAAEEERIILSARLLRMQMILRFVMINGMIKMIMP
jgi:hypothetical protein